MNVRISHREGKDPRAGMSLQVLCAETGRELNQVREVRFRARYDSLCEAQIELFLEHVDVNAQAEITARLPDGHLYKLTRIDSPIGDTNKHFYPGVFDE